MKPLVLMLVFTLFASPAHAQQPRSVDGLNAQIKTFRNSKKFKVSYDKFKDETQIAVGGFLVKAPNGESIARVEVSAHIFLAGKDPSNARKAYLRFHIYGQQWRFLYRKHLYVIRDGERNDFGEGEHTGRVTGTRYASISESLIFSVSLEALKDMSAAKALEIQVGGVELKIEDEHKEAFRDLLKLVS